MKQLLPFVVFWTLSMAAMGFARAAEQEVDLLPQSATTESDPTRKAPHAVLESLDEPMGGRAQEVADSVAPAPKSWLTIDLKNWTIEINIDD